MRKKIFFLGAFFLLLSAVQAQKIHNHVECYGHQGTELIRIPPPKKFLEKGRTESRAKINVTYIGFSDSARTAFQRAVDIWESLLISPVTINVEANWSKLGKNILGSARASDFTINREGTLKADTWYHYPLAEKLYGKDLNKSDEADIIASFSSETNWYYGTDGQTPLNKYDLVTVVLHEIGHGLGFSSFARMDTLSSGLVQGSYGLGTNNPNAFDRFIGDQTQNLMISYRNNSVDLKTLFIGGQMYFYSELAKNVIKEYPKLHAPSRYVVGTSISHVDPNIFFMGTPNSLMAPSIAMGTSIHDPGQMMLNMFMDMGWVANVIRHEALKDLEEIPQKLDFKINIQKDTTYNAKTLTLHYSTDNFKNKKTVSLQSTGKVDEFMASIQPENSFANYQYYFTFKDTIRENRFPAKSYYSFNISPDTTAPKIVHEPIRFALEADNSVDISAGVTDDRQISSVMLEYSIKGEIFEPMEMRLEDGIYKTTLLFGQLKAGDEIRYRIVAKDFAKKTNIGYSNKDFHVFKIEGKQVTRDFYANNFDGVENTDFVGAFKISKPTGFSSFGLHSPHPYLEAGGNNKIDYIHQLRVPIRVRTQRAFMEFDEVVLVEPGEDKAPFGTQEFYDYVVTEGSKDGGATWSVIEDGYDSRAYQEWLSHYQSSMEGQNSTAVGNERLYKRRVINLHKRFKAGDEILIRFRLFSDPGAAAWGWAIDNLEIQTPTVGTEKEFAKTTDLLIYPNPSEGSFTLQANFNQIPESLNIEIFNLQGQKVWTKSLKTASNLELKINLDNNPKGLYMVKIQSANGSFITRKIVLR